MTDMTSVQTGSRDTLPWGLVLAFGASSLLLGIVLAAWPGETIRVVAWLVAIQLLIGGGTQVVLALVSRGVPTLGRVLTGVSGLFSLVVGVLILTSPFQTLEAISILVGFWLLLLGATELVLAFVDSGPGRRAWDLLRAGLCVVAGLFLMVNPERSLLLLVVVVAAWLIAFGFFTVLSALRLRRDGRSATTGAVGRQSPLPGDA